MLAGYLAEGAVEGTLSGEPFVDDDAQRVLIAGLARLAPQLFGGHVVSRAAQLLQALLARALRDEGEAKIAQQDVVAPPQQHVIRLDIAMDKLLIVRVLQAVRNLLDVGNDGFERKRGCFSGSAGAACRWARSP